jgi:hypothetical protein
VKRGFSVHELLISLTVMGIVFALITHFALQQMRVFRYVDEVGGQRSQLGQVAGIVRNLLANVSPSAGELLVAQDSALEVRATIGTAFVCGGAPGQVAVPAPDASAGAISSAILRPPMPGDRLSALFSDSNGATWLHLQVASPPTADGGCSFNPAIQAWIIATLEPVSLPPGTPLRITRPLRLSLYRSADNRWYLGARDWNGEDQRFNGIQPVAGPLFPHEDDARSGLRFEYHDAQGAGIAPPVDAGRVTSVTVVARAATDSMTAVIRLSNAP